MKLYLDYKTKTVSTDGTYTLRQIINALMMQIEDDYYDWKVSSLPSGTQIENLTPTPSYVFIERDDANNATCECTSCECKK